MLVIEGEDVRHECRVYGKPEPPPWGRHLSRTIGAQMPPPDRSQLRVFGFPLHVRPGFLVFIALLVFINGDEFGVWLAVAVAGFTLLHELGHAVAARRAGARAEISLDFMAGYASYAAPRPLGQGTQALIALAGPVTHIAAGVAVLALMGVNPLDEDSWQRSAATQAVWWAGPVIGLFNLLPLLPLDGGNVVTSLLERILPGRARRIMLYVSLGLTISAAVYFAVAADLRTFTVFLALIVVMQLQLVFDDRERHAVSVFDKALTALRAGDADRATRTMVNGLRRPGSPRVIPRTLDDDGTRQLLALLPHPLPTGDPFNEYVLANLLLRTGAYDEAARYGAESYGREPQPLMAATVARAAGALLDEDTAAAWLRAAAGGAISPDGLAAVIDNAPELAVARQRADVMALRRSLGVAPR
jgi:Zn-dependent protease